MNTRYRLLMIFFTLMLWSFSVAAQQSKPRHPKPQAKPLPEEKAEPVVAPESHEEALRRVLSKLSEQIDTLALEVKKMRQETERNSTLLELALLEERLTRLEDKLDNAATTKANLDMQEVEVQRRQRNIQQELTLRGAAALRRDETEAALRQEFQRILESLHAQQSTLQTRITDLQTQADRLRFRIETLRKKADRLELKNDSETNK
ncbi:MAG: hypothetical protein HY231_06435 [Acidobacteria bacterium]|nr:hypothetical protein [Acidobacteriota bacterium]